jgi:hypothetical protein
MWSSPSRSTVARARLSGSFKNDGRALFFLMIAALCPRERVAEGRVRGGPDMAGKGGPRRVRVGEGMVLPQYVAVILKCQGSLDLRKHHEGP